MKNYTSIVFITLVGLLFTISTVYAVSTLTVPAGGTGKTSFPVGTYLVGNNRNALIATTSPTVGYITATNTSATSIFQNVSILGTCTGCVTGGTITGGGGTNMLTYWTSASVIGATSSPTFNSFYATSTTATSTVKNLSADVGFASPYIISNLIKITGNSTSTFAGGVDVLGLKTNVLEITGDSIFGGKLFSASVATNTLPYFSSTLIDVPTLNISTIIKNSGSATSTFAGGITTAGLSSTNGLTITGGDIISSGRLKVDSTANSYLMGNVGIGTTTPAYLLDVNGILNAGSNTGTSTLFGYFKTNGLFKSLKALIGGFKARTEEASLNIDCEEGNYQEFPLTSDIAVNMKNCQPAQVLTLGISVASGGDFQIDWNGTVASSSLYWPEATSTVGYMEQGRMNLCSFRFATTTNFAFASCANGFSPR